MKAFLIRDRYPGFISGVLFSGMSYTRVFLVPNFKKISAMVLLPIFQSIREKDKISAILDVETLGGPSPPVDLTNNAKYNDTISYVLLILRNAIIRP